MRSQEELKTMLNLVRPEYFIPVHGEYRMLRRHGELGVAMGVDPKKVLIGDNGQIFEFDKDGGRKGGAYKLALSSLMALALVT